MVRICDQYNNENYNDYFSYFNFPLSDFQKWAIESIVTGNHCLITAHTGSGKCLKFNTEILMFDGSIKKVQDIKVGDKLMGDDSTERNVLGLARGIEPMYKINLSDDDNFTCNESHILCLKCNIKPFIKDNKNANRYEVYWFDYNEIKIRNKTINYKNNIKEKCLNEAKKLLDEKLLIQKHDFNISINDFLKLPKYLQRNSLSYKVGVEFPEKNIEIDPYIMGLWLGCGSAKNEEITCQDAVILKFLHKKIIEYDCYLQYRNGCTYGFISLKNYINKERENYIKTILNKYDLLNNKHIPDNYKINSRVNRLKLLAGLIDSNGYYCCKSYEISEKNNMLANDILYLAKSLGFACNLKQVKKSCNYDNVKKESEYYRIIIFGDNLTEIPVLCKRKKSNEERLINKSALEYYFKVEPQGNDYYYGFELDGNHKFILGNFVVTHNTLPAEFAIQYFKQLGKKVIYTGPIKALCNQKLYDFRNKYSEISFGILTGDIKDNPDADVLIMTTEILRNTLFNKEVIEKDKNNNTSNTLLSFEMDFYKDLGAVIFDEIHYIGDEDRGSVWEQSLILLPPHIQLIMLSATIDKPENFAKWIQELKYCNDYNKEVYLCSTLKRVVPLIHYNWLTCHHQTRKNAIKMYPEFKNYINKPVLILNQDKKFNEENFKNIIKSQKIIEDDGFIKRKFILNELVKYLNQNNMLPALCFIFSRKNVEIAAKEIDFSLFSCDDKTPNIIENECKQILIKKLPNYKEYINLPEYVELINLLKKGIAIHHAGIMPILREIVELLFEKNYIKLLFATETFAVGINMPTKSVIFTSLYKFDGNIQRELYSHEYIQMAGRAGRRGIDKIGHVIHCNNLFKLDLNNYKNLLCGSAKLLTSHFKISFNLILKIIYSNSWEDNFSIEDFKNFVGKSMIKESLSKEQSYYIERDKEIKTQLEIINNQIKNLSTPKEIFDEYIKLKSQTNLRNNQKRKNSKLINDLENKYNILQEFPIYDNLNKLLEEERKNLCYQNNVNNYIENNIQNVLDILINNNFISNNFKILEKGIISSQIQEVHSLIFAELYEYTIGFKNYTTEELILIFSCFTNINIDDTLKTYNCNCLKIDECSKHIKYLYNKYEDLQNKNYIPNDTETIFHLDLINDLPEWINAENESQCLIVIEKIKHDKNIFLGDFVKAILKINTIASELDKICDILDNLELKQKLMNIGKLTLKYVATNQSLYI